jgi:hypothetical protein
MRTIHERRTPQTSDLNSGAAFGCPRYERCSAAFCPALGGKHLTGERVCLQLREAVKRHGAAKIRTALPGDLAGVVLRHARRLLCAPGALGDELRRASATPSKVEAGRQLLAGTTPVDTGTAGRA